MVRLKVAWNAAAKTATVIPYATALPGGTTNAGDFYHDDVQGDNDKAGDHVGHGVNHVMFHHVRDVLYKNGVLDMQPVKITISI